MKRAALVSILVILVPAAYLALKKAPVDPAAYAPPPKPAMTGPLAPNRELAGAELLGLGKVDGPEDTAVDAAGRVYGGTRDGRIVRVLPGGEVETFAETGGRPLGMMFDAAGNLVVCDAYKGLVSIDGKGAITVLATEAGGVPFMFTDDLDIARDGAIYFTDASSRFDLHGYLYDLLEARPHGRLMRHDPRTGTTRVLLRDLHFANGVALSKNEDFVLVNETYRYRIVRYWLRGPKRGTRDVFIDNLPGFPDNISSNRQGTFWLALFTVRNDMVDRIHPSPFLKRQLAKLPRFLWPKPARYGLVLALDESGKVTRSLHDPDGERLFVITSAKEHGDHLYMGSLESDRIGKYRLRRDDGAVHTR